MVPCSLEVNCGMLLIIAAIKGDDWSNYNFKCTFIKEWAKEYTHDIPNFSQLGVTSLLLTVVNVIMVAVGATLM